MTDGGDYTCYSYMRVCAEKYRHMRILQAPMAEAEFSALINSAGYVMFTSQREKHRYLPDSLCIWVIIGESSVVAKESKAFQTMWSAVNPPEGANIVLVSSTAFRSNITSVVESKRAKMPSQYIECVLKHVFMFEVPLHSANNPHTIAEQAEIEMYKERTCTDAIFKRILPTDPQVVWIGARPGDIIRIDVISYSSCTAVDYRLI